MKPYQPYLDWIDDQSQKMLELVRQWARINSHSFNLEGLKNLSLELTKSFAVLSEDIRWVAVNPMEYIDSRGWIQTKPLGQALMIKKRPFAPLQVLLMCHMDTVYPKEDQPQEIVLSDKNTLKGPGVCDAKGGIAIMLKALEALERSPFSQNMGWQIVINPDEEVGSPGSRLLFDEIVKDSHLGLVFEPCLPSGDLIATRKGSGNFTLIVHGRSAHAGRDFESGRNAIEIMAKCISQIVVLRESRPGLIVNIGLIEGGKALNVVADMAIARFNIRIDKNEDEAYVWVDLKRILNEYAKIDGVKLELHGGFFTPPKILDAKTQRVFEALKQCAKDLNFDIQWQPSGGVCDGNRLAGLGLSNVDTVGAKGGLIHSSEEFLCVDSLTQRAKLTALFLMKLGSGEIKIEGES